MEMAMMLSISLRYLSPPQGLQTLILQPFLINLQAGREKMANRDLKPDSEIKQQTTNTTHSHRLSQNASWPFVRERQLSRRQSGLQ